MPSEQGPRQRIEEEDLSGKSYYELLGVSPAATDQEIKSAFRKRAKETHPDINKSDETHGDEFRVVREAYETLSDTAKRKNYDSIQDSIGKFRTSYSTNPEKPSHRGAHSHSSTSSPPPHNTTPPNRGQEPRHHEGRPPIHAEWRIGETLHFSIGNRGHDGTAIKIIARNGGYFIGEDVTTTSDGINISNHFKYLLDPSVGVLLDLALEKIEYAGGYFIGTAFGMCWLLNQQTHEWSMAVDCKRIVVKDGLVMGKNIFGFEFLLNKNTGEKISNTYKRIEKRDKKIIGHKILGGEEEISAEGR